jgi:SAM-dependent methyltransferase
MCGSVPVDRRSPGALGRIEQQRFERATVKKAAGDYYDKIAHLYDLMYNKDTGFDHLACVQWVHGWREQCGLAKTVLDLACGTGKHLACFQALGYECRGVDASAAMLAVAKSNLPGVPLEVGDFHNFTVPEKVPLITSFFNALSYNTTAEEFRVTLRNVKHHLTANGLLVFDIVCSGPLPFFGVKSFHSGQYQFSRTVVSIPTPEGYKSTMYFVVFDGATSEALAAETLRGMYSEAEVTTLLEVCGYRVLYCGNGYTRSPATVFVAQPANQE